MGVVPDRCKVSLSSGDLVNRVSKRLDQLIQPQSFAVYVRTGSSFVPAFQRGRVVPANFDASERWIAELGEREVSVLFVDIRGYTSFAESKQAREIFSTVIRYTQRISDIVWRHGGSVVEFNGDGMMVVFGAPEELPSKELAAVEAGRAIVESMRRELTGLSVGVGVATGPAFVGNIRAVDRMIWTAIGNTTNLAARLQALTRTHNAAGNAAADFVAHRSVPIRGRRDPEDIFFALPIRAK